MLTTLPRESATVAVPPAAMHAQVQQETDAAMPAASRPVDIDRARPDRNLQPRENAHA